MKRVLTILFAFLMFASMSSLMVAQNTDKAEKKEAKAAEKGKTMSLTGWIKTEDGKPHFVNDKDKKTWEISNPDAVQGHDGHHVKIKAKLDEPNHSVNVESLSMLSKSKQTGEEQKK